MYLCVMGIGFVSFYWLAIKFSSNYSCFLDSVVHVFEFVVKTQTNWTYFLLQIHSKLYTLTECMPYSTNASERTRMVIVSWLKQVYLGDIQTQTIKQRRNCTPCFLFCAPRGNTYKKHFTMVSFIRTLHTVICIYVDSQSGISFLTKTKRPYIEYSVTCLNRTLKKPKSCITQEILVDLTCANRKPV